MKILSANSIKNTTQSFWKRRKPLSDEQTIKILTKDLNKYLIQIQTDYDPNLAASIRNLLPEIQSSYGLYMYGLDPESSEFSRIYKESEDFKSRIPEIKKSLEFIENRSSTNNSLPKV